MAGAHTYCGQHSPYRRAVTRHLLVNRTLSVRFSVLNRSGNLLPLRVTVSALSKPMMTLLSAHDDFQTRTLAAIPGPLARLRYVAGLYDSSRRRYSHWGLERVHGMEAAEQAIRRAHFQALLELLRTPLEKLVQEVEAEFPEQQKNATTVLEELERPHTLPPGLSEASAMHFRSVLLALRGLVHVIGSSTPRGALQRRQPVL